MKGCSEIQTRTWTAFTNEKVIKESWNIIWCHSFLYTGDTQHKSAGGFMQQWQGCFAATVTEQRVIYDSRIKACLGCQTASRGRILGRNYLRPISMAESLSTARTNIKKKRRNCLAKMSNLPGIWTINHWRLVLKEGQTLLFQWIHFRTLLPAGGEVWCIPEEAGGRSDRRICAL